MEEMDDLFAKLQVYLVKKDAECGQLRFLTSRTTSENSKDIQDVCDGVSALVESCGIPTGEESSTNDPRCVQAFKYLVLNTYFTSQEHLTEDPLNGHLVDMSPPLSPYLLTEILWSLRYEEILAESILHVPLDLAVELLEISQRCLCLLDFSRGLNFLSRLTTNCYKKLRFINEKGALTTCLDESLEILLIRCQELTSLFFEDKFTRYNEVSGMQKSERHGFILKNIIKLAGDCLYYSKNSVDLASESVKLYKLTYGRESRKAADKNFSKQLSTLDQEIVGVLLKKLKEVEVNTYIDWASIEDRGNSDTSMQKSLGIDCYNFIEFTKDNDDLIDLKNLIECLQQISSKPEVATCSRLDLERLKEGAIDGNKECLKELMKRYREWDHATFTVVDKNRCKFEKDDFFHLLEYLTCVMTKEGQEEHKRNVYATVTRVLMQQDIKNVYETIIEYILKHDARNTLESSNTEEVFKSFMAHNKNFKTSTNLRLVLFFLVKNPRKILSILVKMAIGHEDYENVMITPSDLLLITPVMNIREKSDETLLLGTLREICLENGEWSTKKFENLIRVMLDECVLKADDLANKIFVPCLDAKNDIGKTRSMLNFLRKILPTCTKSTNFEALVLTIARKMSRIRGNSKARKYTIGQIIELMSRVIKIITPRLKANLAEERRMEFIEKLENLLGPIDRHHFAGLLAESEERFFVRDILRDYERRCFVGITRIQDCSEATGIDRGGEKSNFDPGPLEEDCIRHIIVRSTETEYLKFSTETILQWDILNCDNEYEAYEKVVRSTTEACIFCLEFPGSNSPDTFASLIKSLARFTRALTNVESIRDIEKIDKSLIDNFRGLDASIKRSTFSNLYTNVLVAINNRDSRESINDKLLDLVVAIDDFGKLCLEIPHSEINFQGERSARAQKYKIAHEFLDEITSLDYVVENNSIVCRIYELLCSQEARD